MSEFSDWLEKQNGGRDINALESAFNAALAIGERKGLEKSEQIAEKVSKSNYNFSAIAVREEIRKEIDKL